MTEAAASLQLFFAEAWTALAGAAVVLGLIFLLVHVLRMAGSAAVGAGVRLADSAGAALGLVFILIFALTGVPALAAAVDVTVAACGPLAELGAAAAGIIAALASLRMLLACLKAAAMSSLSGGYKSGDALIEAGEAVIGMLLAVLAAPLAAHFLGAC